MEPNANPMAAAAPQETKADGGFLELPLPRQLYEGGIIRADTTLMRYMPSHHRHRVPRLRFGAHRHIRLAIVVTMYAEGADAFVGTLQAIAQNITNFHRLQAKGSSWGMSWDEILVVIVADGMSKINEGTLRKAEEIGLAKESLIFLAEYNGILRRDDVQLHHFDAFLQLAPNRKVALGQARHLPMQTVLAIKANNCGKLDSHKWFFDAYCAQVNPEFVMLIDVGTRPAEHAIVNLVGCMMRNVHIGGCCGEIVADVSWSMGSKNSVWTNWAVAAQVFEYKISHVMDKTWESWIGFITVLPGAFSAYRYQALTGGNDLNPGEESPLNKYFSSITAPMGEGQSIFDANMCLAEDRILCFAIVSMPRKSYTLHYEKHSVAVTDVPEDLPTLVKQRRRWLNGSFFAMLYALGHFNRVFTDAKHSVFRCLLFAGQLLYFLLNVLLTWFLPGSFYLSFWVLLQTTLPPSSEWRVMFYVLTYLFLAFAGLILLLSLGNDPVAARRAYRWCCYGFAWLELFTTSVAVVHVQSEGVSTLVVVYVAGVILAFLFCSVLHGQVEYTISTLIQYYFLLPTFVIVFTIFSFCNIHDVSWGTKGIDTVTKALPVAKTLRDRLGRPLEETSEAEFAAAQAEQQAAAAAERKLRNELELQEKQRMHEYRAYRTKFVAMMLASNWAYVTIVVNFVFTSGWFDAYVTGLAGSVGLMLGVRVMGSLFYQLERALKFTCGRWYTNWQEAEALKALHARTVLLGQPHA